MTADCVGQYLEAIARLCLETARNPRLLPVFIEIAKLMPATLRELAGAQRRRIAA